jgi:hypothetical protein
MDTTPMPGIIQAIENGEVLSVRKHHDGKFHARVAHAHKPSECRNALGKTMEEALARLERYLATHP